MGSFLYSTIRPLLFAADPEWAHLQTFRTIETLCGVRGFRRLTQKLFSYEDPSLEISIWGQRFANPIGVAGGFDKDGVIYESLFDLGFSFVEVGTVTPRPQLGNPKPRIFRLPEDNALINRLGFNNQGMDALQSRLEKER